MAGAFDSGFDDGFDIGSFTPAVPIPVGSLYAETVKHPVCGVVCPVLYVPNGPVGLLDDYNADVIADFGTILLDSSKASEDIADVRETGGGTTEGVGIGEAITTSVGPVYPLAPETLVGANSGFVRAFDGQAPGALGWDQTDTTQQGRVVNTGTLQQIGLIPGWLRVDGDERYLSTNSETPANFSVAFLHHGIGPASAGTDQVITNLPVQIRQGGPSNRIQVRVSRVGGGSSILNLPVGTAEGTIGMVITCVLGRVYISYVHDGVSGTVTDTDVNVYNPTAAMNSWGGTGGDAAQSVFAAARLWRTTLADADADAIAALLYGATVA